MKFNSYTLKEINSVLEKVVKSHVEGKGEVLIILTQYESADILVENFLLLEIINSWMINLQQNHVGFKGAGDHRLKKAIWGEWSNTNA